MSVINFTISLFWNSIISWYFTLLGTSLGRRLQLMDVLHTWRKPDYFSYLLQYIFVVLFSMALLLQAHAQSGAAHTIDSLLIAANRHFKATELDSTKWAAQDAKSLALNLGNDSLLGEINIVLSNALILSQKEEAFEVLQQSLALSKSFDSKLLARTYHTISWHFMNQEQYDSAIHYGFLAIPPYMDKEDVSGLAKIYVNLGVCYEELGDSILSKELYQKALSFPKAHNPVMDAHSKHKVGDNERLIDKVSLGKDILNYTKRIGNNRKLIMCYIDISDQFIEYQNYDSAIFYAQEGLDFSSAKNVKSPQQSFYLNLGIANQEKGKYYQALHYYQQILNQDTQPHTRLKALTGMQTCYRQVGEFDLALKMAERIIAFKDSLIQTHQTEFIAQLSLAYDLNKKQEEIESLKKEKEEAERKLRTRYWWIGSILFFGLIGYFYYAKTRQKEKSPGLESLPPVQPSHLDPLDANTLTLSDAKHLYKVGLHEITHIQSSNNYSTFHLLERKDLVISKPLKHFDQLLQTKGFFRCHQSYIVHLQHVISYNKAEETLLLKGGHRIPVSAKKKSELIQLFK